MRKSLLIAATMGLASSAFPSDNRIRQAPAPSPAPAQKRGKPTKAEKKAAKRARTRGVLVDYSFRCYSCSKEWEATTTTTDCPACGTTNNHCAANPRGVATDGGQQR